MHSMSPSSLDMPLKHSSDAHLKNKRQSVDSLSAQAKDDQSFKHALEKSKNHKQNLKEIEKKSHEKANNDSKQKTSQKEAYSSQESAVQKNNESKSTIHQPYEPASEINESALTVNDTAHNTVINAEAFMHHDVELNTIKGINEGDKEFLALENNFSLKDLSTSLGFLESVKYSPDESTVKTLGGSFLINNAGVNLNQKTVSGFAFEQALSALPEATKEGELNTQSLLISQNSLTSQNSLISQQSLSTMRPSMGENNDSLILGQQSQSAITLNAKNMAMLNLDDLPLQDAGLTHQKINSQLSSLMSKGQADGSFIEPSLKSSFLPDSSQSDIQPQLLTAAERAEQRLMMTSADKIVVNANIKVGMPGWADQIAERTASLVSQNIQQAEIQLNPQEMGSINVKISISQDQVAVTFTAQNTGVREALDQSVQRLRDALESEGMDLVQADVGGQSAQSDESTAEQVPELTIKSKEDDSEINNIIVDIPSSGIDQFA